MIGLHSLSKRCTDRFCALAFTKRQSYHGYKLLSRVEKLAVYDNLHKLFLALFLTKSFIILQKPVASLETKQSLMYSISFEDINIPTFDLPAFKRLLFYLQRNIYPAKRSYEVV